MAPQNDNHSAYEHPADMQGTIAWQLQMLSTAAHSGAVASQ